MLQIPQSPGKPNLPRKYCHCNYFWHVTPRYLFTRKQRKKWENCAQLLWLIQWQILIHALTIIFSPLLFLGGVSLWTAIKELSNDGKGFLIPWELLIPVSIDLKWRHHETHERKLLKTGFVAKVVLITDIAKTHLKIFLNEAT